MLRGSIVGGLVLRGRVILAEHYFPLQLAGSNSPGQLHSKGKTPRRQSPQLLPTATLAYQNDPSSASTDFDPDGSIVDEVPTIMALVQGQVQQEPVGRVVMGEASVHPPFFRYNTVHLHLLITIACVSVQFCPVLHLRWQCCHAARVALACLREIHTRFSSEFSPMQIADVPSYGLQSFAQQIRERMTFYSTNQSSAGLSDAKEQLDQVKDVMKDNIERLLERGEKLDDLLKRTDALSSTAVVFHKRSREVHATERWAARRRVVYGGIFATVVTFIIIWIGCGFPTFERCAPRK